MSDFIVEIPDKVWNLFKTSFDVVSDTLKSILDFFVNFFTNLVDFFKKIFVPRETYFDEQFTQVKNSFSDKFKFIGQIDDVLGSVNAQTLSIEELSIKFPKYDVEVDFSWYEVYRGYFRNALMGFFTLIFIAGIVKRNDPKINMGGN